MRFSLEIFNVKKLLSPAVGFASAVSGTIGSTLQVIYGSANLIWMGIYVSMIVMDWISGTVAAKKDKSYGSQYGIEGIFRTVFLLLFPAVANQLDKALGTQSFLFFTVIGGLIYHTWQSIMANTARAGWEKWIPQRLLESVASEIELKNQRSRERNPFINSEKAFNDDGK